jgi:Lrp/AsnC family leucine-responsive transcriptional regulator
MVRSAIRDAIVKLECHHITGAWNYLLKARVGTTCDLERFLTDTIKAVDGVERTETLITLSSAKETWTVSLDTPPF